MEQNLSAYHYCDSILLLYKKTVGKTIMRLATLKAASYWQRLAESGSGSFSETQPDKSKVGRSSAATYFKV